MDIEGQRRSDNFEDRGQGGGSSRAGAALPLQLLFGLMRLLGWKGTLVVAAVVGAGYYLLPGSVKQQLLGGGGPGNDGLAGGSVCQMSPGNGKACDFSRVVLASTEDVWSAKFRVCSRRPSRRASDADGVTWGSSRLR